MIVRGDVFEQVAVEGVARAVIDQVEGLIVAGVLRSGQKMPAERELAETLGVSRPKLREALADLEARGLIVTRHGDGTYVANLTGAALSAPMVELFARHPQAFFDYLEYRRESEGFAAFLAA
ncbi:MAG: GntR family transcriptional regulator, partial [Alphaproteobacteria bacterium]|nr:GntR family transcriptional regulator [Alphaproteobacteria bacterium]